MHAWHWDISSFFRLVCVNILLISYDYYQFLEGCQSGVVERFAVPDQAAPNLLFILLFTVVVTDRIGILMSVLLLGTLCAFDGVFHPL